MAAGVRTKGEEFRRGWRVLLASAFGAGTGAVPLAFYSFSSLVDPLTKGFGWTRGEVTAAPLFLTVGGLVAGVLVGALADRFGPRRIVIGSQVALALLALLPRSLPLFYAGYVLIALLGAGTMTMTWARTITGWFVSGRGLALGVSLVGTGLIGALMPSYVSYLTAHYGWRAAYLGLAALPLLLGLPLSLAFFRDAPDDVATPERPLALDDGSFSFAEATRTLCFWQMVAAFTIVALAIASVIVHCVPLLTDRGIDKTTAAGLAGLFGLAVTVGRLISGYSLDVVRGPLVAFAMFALPALACLLLTVSGSNLWLCGTAIVIVGLAGGAEHDIAAYFCAKYFGRRHYGKVYGLLYTLYGLGSGIGPLVTGNVVDLTGSYTNALYAGSGLFALASMLILLLKPPLPKTARS